MKKTFLTAVFVALAIVAGAQDKNAQRTYQREGKTFVQSTGAAAPSRGDQATAYRWRDAKGNEYPIILHTYQKGEKAGRVTAYVVRTSAKTGKEYKYYLPDGERIAAEILSETE